MGFGRRAPGHTSLQKPAWGPLLVFRLAVADSMPLFPDLTLTAGQHRSAQQVRWLHEYSDNRAVSVVHRRFISLTFVPKTTSSEEARRRCKGSGKPSAILSPLNRNVSNQCLEAWRRPERSLIPHVRASSSKTSFFFGLGLALLLTLKVHKRHLLPRNL